jgi:hypothetical protein
LGMRRFWCGAFMMMTMPVAIYVDFLVWQNKVQVLCVVCMCGAPHIRSLKEQPNVNKYEYSMIVTSYTRLCGSAHYVHAHCAIRK